MYRARIEKDFNGWVEKGLVEQAAAKAMLAEYDARGTTFTAGRVLTVLAALLFSAAILLLVASNWELIPRIARVAGIVALIWGFYLSAGLCLAHGRSGLGAALLVLGTMTFGGAIALIGQMYHLSGDAADALLVWLGAAAIAAILFRSAALAVLSGFLAFAFFGQLIADNDMTLEGNGLIYLVPFLALAVLGLVRYTRAGLGRHLAYLLALAWLGWFYLELSEAWLAGSYVILGLVAFLLAALPRSPLHRVAGEAGAAPAFYTFTLAILGLVALHLETDSLDQNIVVSAVTLAVSVGGIAIAGRLNGAVRFLGYAVFAVEILYLAFETVGSIIGTSGFFLLSGLVVAAIAFLVVRLEKRLSARVPAEEI